MIKIMIMMGVMMIMILAVSVSNDAQLEKATFAGA